MTDGRTDRQTDRQPGVNLNAPDNRHGGMKIYKSLWSDQQASSVPISVSQFVKTRSIVDPLSVVRL